MRNWSAWALPGAGYLFRIEMMSHTRSMSSPVLYMRPWLSPFMASRTAPSPISKPDASIKATVEVFPEHRGTTHIVDLGTVYTYARSNAALCPADMIKRDRIRKLLNFEH
jgi:hypothetical protein